jgi:hypothetical protein
LANGYSTVIGFSKNTERTMLRFHYSLPEEFDDGDEDDGPNQYNYCITLLSF